MSTTQQLMVWLVALGLIVLLSIAYMACHAYLAAWARLEARLEARLDRLVANAVRINRGRHINRPTNTNGSITDMQTDGDGRSEPGDKAEQARCALAAAEEELERARAQAAEAEEQLERAQAQAAKAEREARDARAQAYDAEREAKAQLAEEVASKIADWQKGQAT